MGLFNKLFGSNDGGALTVATPVNGEVVPISQVKDETFSQNMIGKGFAVIPNDGNFVSPIDGEVSLIAETGHAYSIKAKNNIQVLVHIGLETVNINSKRIQGEPLKVFKPIVKIGDHVKVGTPIMTANLAEIKGLGYDLITPVVVINDEFSANKQVNNLTSGPNIKAGTKILEVK
jgi:PTS system beta-glucosides-specific IIC component